MTPAAVVGAAAALVAGESGAPDFAAHLLAAEAERAGAVLASRGAGPLDLPALWRKAADRARQASAVLTGERSPALAASVLEDVIAELQAEPRLRCPDAVRLLVYLVRLAAVLSEFSRLRGVPSELVEIGFGFAGREALAFAVTGKKPQSARVAALWRVVEAGAPSLWTVVQRGGRAVFVVPAARLRPGYARHLPRGPGRGLIPVPPFPELFGSSSVHFRAAVLFLRALAAFAAERARLRGEKPKGAVILWDVLGERCELGRHALLAHVDGWRGQLYRDLPPPAALVLVDPGAAALLAAELPQGPKGKLRSDRGRASVRRGRASVRSGESFGQTGRRDAISPEG